jgi:hypothetical protein
MSRLSNLRDAVAAHLSTELTTTVETTVVSNFLPEDLDEPIIAVKSGDRVIEIDMGVDSRVATIIVSVLGRKPTAQGFNTDPTASYRAQEVAACDVYDQIAEDVLAVWTPLTNYARTPIAGHRLTAVTQDVGFDVPAYYENGVWFSNIVLTFYDYHDEDA